MGDRRAWHARSSPVVPTSAVGARFAGARVLEHSLEKGPAGRTIGRGGDFRGTFAAARRYRAETDAAAVGTGNEARALFRPPRLRLHLSGTGPGPVLCFGNRRRAALPQDAVDPGGAGSAQPRDHDEFDL